MHDPQSRKPAPDTNEWRLDPRDVRRHEQRMRQAQRPGLLENLFRYGGTALAVVAIIAAALNFDTLRGIKVNFDPLTSLFSKPDDGGTDTSTGGIEDATVEAPGVVGEAIETSLSTERPPLSADDAPADDATAPPAPSVAEPPPAVAASAAVPETPSAVPARIEEPPEPDIPETFDFGLPSFTVSEADASAAVIVLREGGRRGEAFITWWTSDGTAKAGSDYVAIEPRTERFAPGEQNRTLHVPIMGDRNAEGPETFYVQFALGADGSPGDEIARTEVLINDDD